MRWLIILLALVVFLVPQSVLAVEPDDADVVITARGAVVAPPIGFTVYHISDYEVGLEWVKPVGAENTMIRKAINRLPQNRDDGILVYYGEGESTSDYDVELEWTDKIIYYRAWSQRDDGTWEEAGADGLVGGVGMTLLVFAALGLGMAAVAELSKFRILNIIGGMLLLSIIPMIVERDMGTLAIAALAIGGVLIALRAFIGRD